MSWRRLLPGFSLSQPSFRKLTSSKQSANASKLRQKEHGRQHGNRWRACVFSAEPLASSSAGWNRIRGIQKRGPCFIGVRNLLWDPVVFSPMPSMPHAKRIPKRVPSRKKIPAQKSEPVRLSGSVTILQRYSQVVNP